MRKYWLKSSSPAENQFNSLCPQGKFDYANYLKRRITLAEHVLFNNLKDRRLANKEFVFQAVVFGWIADFLNIEHKLIVEVDGGYHDDPKQKDEDKKRDETLIKRGFKIIRLSNNDVLHHTQYALYTILKAINPRAKKNECKINKNTLHIKRQMFWEKEGIKNCFKPFKRYARKKRERVGRIGQPKRVFTPKTIRRRNGGDTEIDGTHPNR